MESETHIKKFNDPLSKYKLKIPRKHQQCFCKKPDKMIWKVTLTYKLKKVRKILKGKVFTLFLTLK